MVTGANGQLGRELQKLAPGHPQYEFIFLSKEDLPVHHFGMVRQYFQVYHPAYLINCAAYTAVDRAESEKERAFHINGEAVGVLAAVCRQSGTKMIHFSTDYVFDGTAHTPYREEAITNPQSVYGASKLEGEKQALQFNPESIIIRTSWVYSEFGKNFVRTMLKLMQDKKEVKVVNDQFGSPTYAADLAELILKIIHSGKWIPGIYHFCNDGVISWYDFAVAIKEMTGSNCVVQPIPTSAYPTAAKRPAYSALDTHKIRDIFPVTTRDWRDSLKTCLQYILK